MTITKDFNLKEFNAWSGAVDTKNTILDRGKEQQFEQLMEELYPNGISETALNDILWFDDEWIYKNLGIEN